MSPTAKLPACIHLTLTFNEHAVYYQTAHAWVEESEARDPGYLQWITPDERDRAIARNSIWVCQWYPDTPVGFHVFAASSFEALVNALGQEKPA